MVAKTIDETVNEIKKKIAGLRTSEKMSYLTKIIRTCGNPELIRRLLPFAEELNIENEEIVEIKVEEAPKVQGGLEEIIKEDDKPKKEERIVTNSYLQKDDVPSDYMSKETKKMEVKEIETDYLSKDSELEIKLPYSGKRQDIISDNSYITKKLNKEIKYGR